ncbi:MAG: YlxR family protein [Tissierellia bacterium]|nr:YlxR family protein [Tissierellia bacterium]
MRVRKIPLRKCIGCGENKPKKEMIRVVRNKELEVKIDPTGKMNGRGAYICPNISCLEQAKKSKRLSNALEIEIPSSIYEELRELMESDME